MELRSKYLGGMVGSALGDAIGQLAFHHRERDGLLAAVEQAEQLLYTDDTAMAIGLAQSILEKGGIDPQHLGDTFSRNFYREPWRGYAAGPPAIFASVRLGGMSYVEAARNLFGGAGSWGNGAAMRIVPVGLAYHGSGFLYQAAVASAEVTHAHPVGKDGAAALAWAIAEAVRLDPEHDFHAETFLQGLVAFARTEEIRQKLKQVGELIPARVPPQVAASRLGQSVAVTESLPFALYCFLLHPKSYPDCLLCAVTHGGDRDTLGAMAGAVSGAYLGKEAIPEAWQRKLENRELIEYLAESLFRWSSLDLDRRGGGV